MTLTLDDKRPPVPPADLILRVALSFDAEHIDEARTSFDLDSLAHLQRFENALASVGRSFVDFERLLDFGCGCGRFLRHLRPISDRVEIHGTDIDGEMIEWVSRNIPYARTSVGQMQPPLPYSDQHFDLVINHSVFTHLDEVHQDLWLAELRRITRPDGLVLLTVEGQSSWNRTTAFSEQAGESVERWRDELESRGILAITDDQLIGSTHPDSYHSTVHAPWYVFEHWNEYFDVRSYLVDGSISQDLIVLRRRADDAPVPRPIGHRGHAAPAAGAAADPQTPPDASGQIELDPAAVNRQLNMLRAAIYEQGRRISVIAAQLRDEIAESRPSALPSTVSVSPRSAIGRVLRRAARRGRRMLRERA